MPHLNAPVRLQRRLAAGARFSRFDLPQVGPVRQGDKFKDGDLIGIPFRVTIGPKGLKQGQVELRPRRSKQVKMIKIDQALEVIQKFIAAEAPRL